MLLQRTFITSVQTRTSANIAFEDPIPTSLTSYTAEPQEYFCISDVIFADDVGSKAWDLRSSITMTLGSKGHFLYSPMKNLNNEGSATYLHRLSFAVPKEEVEYARFALASAATSKDGKQSEEAPSKTHWGKFVAKPEASDYLQKKIQYGFTYVPAVPGPEAKAICQSNANVPQLEKVLWSSIYRIRYAAADTYHKSFPSSSAHGGGASHVLLVGDAAHVHSPFGGQGMNLGIRDGLRCGKAIMEHWRLSQTSNGKPTNSQYPLDLYADIQRQEGIQTIETTKKFSRLATLKTTTWKGMIRDWVIWVDALLRSRRNAWIWTVSGLAKPGLTFATAGR